MLLGGGVGSPSRKVAKSTSCLRRGSACRRSAPCSSLAAVTSYDKSVDAAPQRLVKPRLRGVFHELGFYAAAAVGVVLVVTAEPGRARIAGAVFASCVAVCFGASAVYHRPTWRPRARAWLARLDHAGVYLLIAGSYVPFALIVMSRGDSDPRDRLERDAPRDRPEAVLGARTEVVV